jgi:hypothetical protein
VGAQVLAAAFPKCGIEMRNQMRRDASTLNLPIGTNLNTSSFVLKLRICIYRKSVVAKERKLECIDEWMVAGAL